VQNEFFGKNIPGGGNILGDS